MCGQNPLCYTYDGVRCMRGGPYEPVSEDVRHGFKFGYGDESVMLANAILEIHRESINDQESQAVAEVLQDLERSAGKRLPR